MIRPGALLQSVVFEAFGLFTRLASTVRGPIELDRPVFIVGAQRSGTRLLETYLNLSPRLCAWSEANHVWEPHYYLWHDRSRSRSSIPGFVGTGVHAHEVPRPHRPSHRRRVRRLFGWYSRLRGKRLLHKNPFNTVRIPLLMDWFEDPRVIHLFRDARAAVNSFVQKNKTAELGEFYTEEELAWMGAYRWKVCVDRAGRAHREFPNELAEVKYSDLTRDPRSILHDLFEFCGLDFSSVRLGDGPAMENRNDKWRRELGPRCVAIVEDVVDDPSPESVGVPDV